MAGPGRKRGHRPHGCDQYLPQPGLESDCNLELRTSQPNDSLLTFLATRKLKLDWTFLGRSIVYLVNSKSPGVGDKTQTRIQTGLAWRQTLTNRWNALAKYEYKIEDDASVPSTALHRQVHLFLADLNFQPSTDWYLSAHYGGKLAFEDSNALSDSSDAHLLAMRATYDLSPRWTVGLCASMPLIPLIHPFVMASDRKPVFAFATRSTPCVRLQLFRFPRS